MINPSVHGWIDKFLQEQNVLESNKIDNINYYNSLRVSGFIYGHVVSIPSFSEINSMGWL